MSRFVRSSKYRHVFGQTAKKEHCYENVKLSNSAWDTNLVSVSAKYISINWNASGGGAFAILPLPTPFNAPPHSIPYKLPDIIPLARSHTATVLDTDWSPHDDSLCASGGEDGKLMIWKVDESQFEGWGDDGWAPQDFDPVQRIEASARQVGQVLWHPSATHVIASAARDHAVKIWDLNNTDSPRATLTGHGDAIQSICFDPVGTLLATTCRDRKLRLFDPRAASGTPVRIADSHGGIKGARVVWCGSTGRLATTGFSKMSDRQLSLWDAGSLNNLRTVVIDQSAGVVMPFYSDNNLLFLAGKGDGNVRYYELETEGDASQLYALDEHKSTDPQRGMCFLPRRALSVSDCEIARAYKVYGATVEPIAFIVPRKADSFQSDIFPPAPSREASISAGDFFSGKTFKQNLVNLKTGSTSTTASSAPPPAPAAAITPVRHESAPSPAAVALPKFVVQTPAVEKAPEPKFAESPVENKLTSRPIATTQPSTSPRTESDSTVRAENARLTSELRDAREQIRALELKVEALTANARKAAAALLDG